MEFGINIRVNGIVRKDCLCTGYLSVATAVTLPQTDQGRGPLPAQLIEVTPVQIYAVLIHIAEPK